MNTTDVGDLAELKFLLAFRERNVPVSTPVGNGQPYDMIVDIKDSLFRFQIKHAPIRDNCVIVKLRSDTYDLTNGRGRNSQSYKDKADFIGAYCSKNKMEYC